MNLFLADVHWGHQNALAFDKRPFETIEEHDKALIENWNNKVDVSDDVYILGDLSWWNSTKTIEIVKQLNGNKHWVVGNHDTRLLRNPELRKLFVEITDYKEITTDDGQGLVLSHYFMPTFKNHYYGWWHFYAHCHLSWEYDFCEKVRREMVEKHNVLCNAVNVGVMMPWIQYEPKTFTEIVDGWEKFNI